VATEACSGISIIERAITTLNHFEMMTLTHHAIRNSSTAASFSAERIAIYPALSAFRGGPLVPPLSLTPTQGEHLS
jgi:hypothetical protein